MGLQTLKRRADFLRVRGGLRFATPALVIEAKRRSATDEVAAGVKANSRFGFTVSKKVGNAVVRNRVRRRLKAAAGELRSAMQADFDYVVIARPTIVEREFSDLKGDLARALVGIHRSAPDERVR